MDFAISADHRGKIKESEKIDKYFNLAKKTEKIVKHESDGDTNCNWYTWNGSLKRLEKLEFKGRIKTIQTTTLRSV